MTDNEIPQPIEEKAIHFLNAVIKHHGHGEARPQQVEMVTIVSRAIEDQEHALIQAGTGVGKTFGHLAPLICSEKRGIVSTATNQLSEQINNIDLPFLNKIHLETFGKPLNYSILKGRANYLCKRKIASLLNLEEPTNNNKENNQGDFLPLLELDNAKNDFLAEKTLTKREITKQRGLEVSKIISWAEKPGIDGDKSHAPAISEEIWKTVSSTNAECPGKTACPFGEECFAEWARDKAKRSKIVVTNHALVGMDLASGEPGVLLGERDVIVFDEVHDLDSYLSSAWGTTLTIKKIEDVIKTTKRAVPANAEKERDLIEELEQYTEKLETEISVLEPGRYTTWETPLDTIFRAIKKIVSDLHYYCSVQAESPNNLKNEQIKHIIAANELDAILESLSMISKEDPNIVKWFAEKTEKEPATFNAAPLRIGPRLMSTLEEAEITMIATSATITVGGEFDIPVRNLSLNEKIPTLNLTPRKYHAIDVGTPFNYSEQGILYIPSPDEFPAPIGKDRIEHKEAVLEFLLKLVQAAGGRTLSLSTTTSGAKSMAEYLKKHIKTPVLTQWDGPPGVIAEKWVQQEEATLCATMGMWHGLNPMGKTCSAVLIDKIPFGPMDDPLMNARQEDVIKRGGNGFMDVYVADANQKLAQGAGRLIRHTTDKGIVAIMDTRLRSKGYGSAMLRSLPPMWRTSDETAALNSIQRLLQT